MTAKILIAAGALAMLVAGCTSDANAQSRAQCEDYAYRMAYRDRDGNDVLRGTIGGAAAGALIGGIVGGGDAKDFGRGALVGGVAGTALNAIQPRGGTINRRVYNRAFNDCIDGDVQAFSARSRVLSQSDIDYCLSRYRSYNPDTGLYLAYSGRYRPCP